ncbi:MAG: 1,2-phenylacetyl-CoA epoxidase subunit PaaC [Actinomycetota bacterium]
MNARLSLLLSLADDELIMGHRMSEWTGWIPYIEEDLAFSSIAQDEMAHARLLYELALSNGAPWNDIDQISLGRSPSEYRNAVICERTNHDYAYTLARHWLYDSADSVRVASLKGSAWKELSEAMSMIALEEQYHVEHARTWFSRVANGPVQARTNLTRALQAIVAESLAIFEPLPLEAELIADGTMPSSSEQMLATWLEQLGAELEAVGLERVLEEREETLVGEMIPTSSGAIPANESEHTLRVPGLQRVDGRWVHVGDFEGAGGRLGKHSPDFEPLWVEMTALYRENPGATW